DGRAGDLLADRVGHLLVHALGDVGRAGDLLAHDVLFPHLAGADLRRAFTPHLLLLRGAAGLAAAPVEAAVGAADLGADLLAGLAVGLADPLAALLLDGLRRADRPGHLLHAFLVAGLDAVGVGGAADVLVAGLADRLAHRAAHFLVA